MVLLAVIQATMIQSPKDFSESNFSQTRIFRASAVWNFRVVVRLDPTISSPKSITANQQGQRCFFI